MSQELVVIEKKDVLTVFTEEGAIDPYLAKIREWIDALPVPDITTTKGRAEIKSNAVLVRDAKIYLEGVGKDLAAEQKKIPGLIDKTRREVDTKLAAWQAEVRQPLTDWEEAEDARKKDYQGRINRMYYLLSVDPANPGFKAQDISSVPAVELEGRIDQLNAIVIDSSWQDFEPAGNKARADTLEALQGALLKRRQHEAEQAELEELRRQKAEREAKEAAEAAAKAQAEHEERIRQEAAQKAQQEAEAKAEAARQAEADRVAKERRDAELREQERVAALELAEKQRADAERRAEQAKIDAENSARETEARIKREQEVAAKKEQEELERRERNKRHAAKINNEAIADFIKGGLTDEMAKIAVILIAKKEIRNVQINY
jgi:hypothetical protein